MLSCLMLDKYSRLAKSDADAPSKQSTRSNFGRQIYPAQTIRSKSAVR